MFVNIVIKLRVKKNFRVKAKEDRFIRFLNHLYKSIVDPYLINNNLGRQIKQFEGN